MSCEVRLWQVKNKTTENSRVANATMPLIDTAAQLITVLDGQYTTRKVHLHTLHQADDKADAIAERAAYRFRASATSDRNS